MNKESTKQEYIEGILKTSRFAVLAIESDGQPHKLWQSTGKKNR